LSRSTWGICPGDVPGTDEEFIESSAWLLSFGGPPVAHKMAVTRYTGKAIMIDFACHTYYLITYVGRHICIWIFKPTPAQRLVQMTSLTHGKSPEAGYNRILRLNQVVKYLLYLVGR
jgi:hypothetical protein